MPSPSLRPPDPPGPPGAPESELKVRSTPLVSLRREGGGKDLLYARRSAVAGEGATTSESPAPAARDFAAGAAGSPAPDFAATFQNPPPAEILRDNLSFAVSFIIFALTTLCLSIEESLLVLMPLLAFMSRDLYLSLVERSGRCCERRAVRSSLLRCAIRRQHPQGTRCHEGGARQRLFAVV